MNAAPEKNTDQVLDDVALSQYFWKPGPLTTAAVEIVKAIMVEPFVIWPDEVNLEKIDADSRCCIGSAYRILAKRGIIEATGAWKRSHAIGRNGGKIFSYRVSNFNLAQEFVRRNSPDTKIGQLDLPGTN